MMAIFRKDLFGCRTLVCSLLLLIFHGPTEHTRVKFDETMANQCWHGW